MRRVVGSRVRIDWYQVVTVYGERDFCYGLLWEVGEGTAVVVAERPLPVGASMNLTLPLPDGDVVVEGEVVWSRAGWSGPSKPPAMGLGFRVIDADGHERLQQFLGHNGVGAMLRAA